MSINRIRRLALRLAALAGAAALVWLAATDRLRPQDVPGLDARERTLLRVWVISAPGGGQRWLEQMIRLWEKQRPEVTVYLRTVTAGEPRREDTVLPDVILTMPGDITEPDTLLTPIRAGDGALREELMRCGRWRAEQYGLPLCWGAWALAIDSAIEPGPAVTPAPTTLLGRPAATAAAPQTPLPYPRAAAEATGSALISPGGTALLSLCMLLPETDRPAVSPEALQLTSADVYARFQKRGVASAMLTTGQLTAFSALVSAGQGFPFRVMTPQDILTDQVWLAGLTPDASPEAAAFLAFLTSREAQQQLAAQGLHTVRDDLTLYTTGFSAAIERAGRSSLSAVNAYLSPEEVQSAAWQAMQGLISPGEAAAPLM